MEGHPTRVVGRASGSPFHAVGNGGPVLGFSYDMGQWANKPALRDLTPLYAGDRPTDMYVMAKEGYAVGALEVRINPYVATVRVVFMRLGDDGRLDKKDSYKSDWLGTRSAGTAQTLGGDGSKVIGIQGRRVIILDALGLVME